MSVKRWLTAVGNRFGAWMYRTLDGRLSSGSKNVHVLLITTPGRRTGVARSTCVRYLDVPEGFLVWGTGSGSPRDPDWFRNLRTAQMAELQVRERRLLARPRELFGAERDAIWNDVDPGVPQHLEMLRDRGAADREGRCQVSPPDPAIRTIGN